MQCNGVESQFSQLIEFALNPVFRALWLRKTVAAASRRSAFHPFLRRDAAATKIHNLSEAGTDELQILSRYHLDSIFEFVFSTMPSTTPTSIIPPIAIAIIWYF